MRQFDVRAVKQQGSCLLALAVECKNVRPECPVLLSAVPRLEAEAFHDVILRTVLPAYPSVRAVAVAGGQSVYKPSEMVGKKVDRVKRDQAGALVSEDGGTFERLNQAVNSCKDLVKRKTASTSNSLPLTLCLMSPTIGLGPMAFSAVSSPITARPAPGQVLAL
jgi:hypothetical protein